MTPTKGIMTVTEFDDYKMYHVACDCGDPDHVHSVVVESTDAGVVVTIGAEVYMCSSTEYLKSIDYDQPVWARFTATTKVLLSEAWNRVATAAKILFSGYSTYKGDFILHPESAKNYVTALQQAIQDIESKK